MSANLRPVIGVCGMADLCSTGSVKRKAFTFNITQNWAAQWSTQYDVERNRFASQQVGLQRQLHDWNAVFAFTQAPNGNFSFNFFIALKAQPELKFNYDRQTYRQSSF